jgi:glycine betaine/proline transport system substrate-binding protein
MHYGVVNTAIDGKHMAGRRLIVSEEAMKRIPVMALATALAMLPAAAIAKNLVIGMPAWPSAQVTAHIIADTVETKLGVETELRERGTMTILGDIGSGTVDVHPEIWLPNLAGAIERLGAREGKLRVSPNGVAASQNICVTGATAEITGIASVTELADPDMAAKFDSDGDGTGEIWIGAPTWSSTEIEKVRAKSYGYDKTMALLEMPEDVAMAAVDVAASLQKPIVFYCYAPHHVFELHEIVVLDEPAHDPATWTLVKRADDPNWLDKSQAGTAWDLSHFHIGYAASVTTDMPEVAAFLGNITLTPEDAAAMSYAVEVEGKAPERSGAGMDERE